MATLDNPFRMAFRSLWPTGYVLAAIVGILIAFVVAFGAR